MTDAPPTTRHTPDYVLELSTEVAPPPAFTIDGDEYKLLGLEHLSTADEDTVMGGLALLDRLQGNLLSTGDEREAKKLAQKVRTKRIELLDFLTDVPKDKLEQLPLPAQVRLIEAVQRETGGGPDGTD